MGKYERPDGKGESKGKVLTATDRATKAIQNAIEGVRNSVQENSFENQ